MDKCDDKSGNKFSGAENFTNSTAAFVDSGKCLVSSSSSWIIDFGVSDHMTGNHSLLCHFSEHRSFKKVEVANGTLSSDWVRNSWTFSIYVIIVGIKTTQVYV